MKELGINGKIAQFALDDVGITCNRNTIPFETLSPFTTSGIRSGVSGFNHQRAERIGFC